MEGSGSGSGGAAKPPGGGADKGGAGASANKFKGVSGSQYKFGVLARYFISSKFFYRSSIVPGRVTYLVEFFFFYGIVLFCNGVSKLVIALFKNVIFADHSLAAQWKGLVVSAAGVSLN